MPEKRNRLIITGRAEKEIADLPPKIGRQTTAAIDRLLDRLSEGQFPQDVRTLRGYPQNYRLDSGEYRILFELDQAATTVEIWRLGHRKDVYRNL